MKKFIIVIISLISLFAIQFANAECHPNTYYYGQIVTYCEWNNSYDSYYNDIVNWYSPSQNYYPYSYSNTTYFDNGYNTPYSYYYNTYWNGSSYDSDSDYCDYNYCDLGNRSKEENYYNLLYLNNLWWPGSSTVKKPDYFKDTIIWKDREIDLLNAIKLKPYAFKYASNTAKYNDTKNYLETLKQKIIAAYRADKISYNMMNTIINDFDFLVYNINMQYQNTKTYDSTWNVGSKETAQEYGDIVRTSYDRVKYDLQGY